jgi:hypothetical protein
LLKVQIEQKYSAEVNDWYGDTTGARPLRQARERDRRIHKLTTSAAGAPPDRRAMTALQPFGATRRCPSMHLRPIRSGKFAYK